MDAKEVLMKLCQVLRDHRINGVQLTVLALIPELNAKEIAKSTEEKEANVHAAIRSLKKREYVTQAIHPQNKRTRVTQVTEKGKELMLELARAFS